MTARTGGANSLPSNLVAPAWPLQFQLCITEMGKARRFHTLAYGILWTDSIPVSRRGTPRLRKVKPPQSRARVGNCWRGERWLSRTPCAKTVFNPCPHRHCTRLRGIRRGAWQSREATRKVSSPAVAKGLLGGRCSKAAAHSRGGERAAQNRGKTWVGLQGKSHCSFPGSPSLQVGPSLGTEEETPLRPQPLLSPHSYAEPLGPRYWPSA